MQYPQLENTAVTLTLLEPWELPMRNWQPEWEKILTIIWEGAILRFLGDFSEHQESKYKGVLRGPGFYRIVICVFWISVHTTSVARCLFFCKKNFWIIVLVSPRKKRKTEIAVKEGREGFQWNLGKKLHTLWEGLGRRRRTLNEELACYHD